jgi:hypothetical protein
MQEVLNHIIALSGISEQDGRNLKEVAPKTQKWVNAVVKEFYDTLYAYEPTANVFQPGERPRLEKTLHDWYMLVTSGVLDDNFWKHMWFVGLVHIKRRVSNAYVLSMMSRIQLLFLKQCMKEFDAAKAERVFSSFKRVLDAVGTLIAEGYLMSYIEGLESVLGFNKALSQQMLDLEIDKKIAEARAQQK